MTREYLPEFFLDNNTSNHHTCRVSRTATYIHRHPNDVLLWLTFALRCSGQHQHFQRQSRISLRAAELWNLLSLRTQLKAMLGKMEQQQCSHLWLCCFQSFVLRPFRNPPRPTSTVLLTSPSTLLAPFSYTDTATRSLGCALRLETYTTSCTRLANSFVLQA